MSDLISRAEAIKAVKFYESFCDPYPRVIESLEKLPSAQLEQRWIPCSERLPEEDGEYLVESTRGYEVLYYREEEKQFGLMAFNFAGEVGFMPKKVYEWMPLPEPTR